LNLKDVDSGRERQIKRSSWLGKGLSVEVNEFGKKRVYWQCYNGDKQVVKWVACGDYSTQGILKVMDHGPFEAHAHWVGNDSSPLLSSPFIFEAVADGNLESSSVDPSSISLPSSSVLESLPPRTTAMAPMVSMGLKYSISAPEEPSGSGSSNQVSPS